MSELTNFFVMDMPEAVVVGRGIRPAMPMTDNPIPAFWCECFEKAAFAPLEAMAEFVINPSYVGLMCDWDGERFTYIVGMFMKPDCPVPEGYLSRKVPAGPVAVGWIRGPEKDNYMVAHEQTSAALTAAGREADEGAMWCAEVYNCPRFTTPQENGDVILDYYIPLK